MGITAKELMDKLKNDPEYKKKIVRKNAEIKKLQAVYRKDERALIKEFKAIGISIKSVWDLINNNNRYKFLRSGAPNDYSQAYPILVKHLHIDHHPRIREGIIRALSEKAAYEDAGQSLLNEFYSESNPDLKWVLANALKTVLPLKERKKHPEIAIVFRGEANDSQNNDI